ncbi:MAG: hypothetical protein LBE76_00445, partial [Nitrososphaerota archaeon]|nr:hypothetical protein [Nitrososphaerota archaeon]
YSGSYPKLCRYKKHVQQVGVEGVNINKGTMILLLCVALLAIPIVWLVSQVGESAPFLVPIVILGNLVIANVIVRKTSLYASYQQPYQHRSFYTFKRVQRTLGAGMLTTIAIGLLTKSLIQPLVPNYLWRLFLVIFFVIGAIIGDTLQRAWQKT